jgi:transposase
MGYVRLRPRKFPKGQDEESRKQFKEQIQLLIPEKGIDLWFSDESGFQGDPTPRWMWAPKGARLLLPYYGSHIRSNVIGAVRAKDGKFVSLMMPLINSDTFQLFLNELNRRIYRRHRNIIILDNATWHKTKCLHWGNLEPLYLPTYSPDLNPIEQLWLVIKNDYFSFFATKDQNELDDYLESILHQFSHRKFLVRSICSMRNFD